MSPLPVGNGRDRPAPPLTVHDGFYGCIICGELCDEEKATDLAYELKVCEAHVIEKAGLELLRLQKIEKKYNMLWNAIDGEASRRAK